MTSSCASASDSSQYAAGVSRRLVRVERVELVGLRIEDLPQAHPWHPLRRHLEASRDRPDLAAREVEARDAVGRRLLSGEVLDQEHHRVVDRERLRLEVALEVIRARRGRARRVDDHDRGPRPRNDGPRVRTVGESFHHRDRIAAHRGRAHVEVAGHARARQDRARRRVSRLDLGGALRVRRHVQTRPVGGGEGVGVGRQDVARARVHEDGAVGGLEQHHVGAARGPDAVPVGRVGALPARARAHREHESGGQGGRSHLHLALTYPVRVGEVPSGGGNRRRRSPVL